MMFRVVICCSGGLYASQGGYTLFRWAICCSGELYDVQEGYMLKKIMMILVATNVVGSQPTGTLVVRIYTSIYYIYCLYTIHCLI